MKKIFAVLLAAAVAVSCVYPFNPEVEAETGNLVVEGDITPGQVAEFHLRYTHALTDVSGNYTDDIDAELWVETENGATYNATKGSTAGTFLVDLRGSQSGYKYALYIRKDGKTYHTDMMPVAKAPVVSEMGYRLDDENVTITTSLMGSDGNRTYKMSYNEIWEFHSDYLARTLFVTEPRPGYQDIPEDQLYEYYYCWRRASSKEFVLADASYNNSNSLVRFPVKEETRASQRYQILYCIDVDIRAITREEYEYLNNLAVSSNGTGDLFTPTPSSMPGNLVCDEDPNEVVLGWVGAVQPTTTRYFLDCAKHGVYRGHLPKESVDLFIPDTSEQPLRWYYEMGYMPVGICTVNFVEGLYWAHGSCVDCRRAGGTKDKPEFWPNDHI